MANLVCPKCSAICEFDGQCYYNVPRFDTEGYAHQLDGMKNSPGFIRLLEAEWDKVFG